LFDKIAHLFALFSSECDSHQGLGRIDGFEQKRVPFLREQCDVALVFDAVEDERVAVHTKGERGLGMKAKTNLVPHNIVVTTAQLGSGKKGDTHE
jgi:hypothetical protein